MSIENYVRSTVTWILLGASAAAQQGAPPGNTYPVNQKTAETVPLDVDLIERELRKWGPWVEELVESDYTDGRRTKYFGIDIFDRKEVPGLSRNVVMAYDKDNNNLAILEPVYADSYGLFMRAIHHELSHLLCDAEGRRGLTFLPEYRGPSCQELSAASIDLLYVPENKIYAEDALAEIQLQYAGIKHRKLKESFDSLSERINNAM